MMGRWRPRGAILVVSVLLSIILLLLGYGMLTLQSRGYSEARLQRMAVQAAWVARAGIEAVTQRLSKDPSFPPPLAGRQVFAVTESVADPTSGVTVGWYTVTIDTTRRAAAPEADPQSPATYEYPAFTIRLRSEGTVRDDQDRVLALRRIDAEIDVSPRARGQAVTGPEGTITNPSYFRFIRWEDSGGL